MTTTTATTATMATSSFSARPALLTGDVLDLVARSREALVEACSATTTSERYGHAQLAALRAAAALLAQVAPRTVGSGPRSAWDAVAQHLPEFGEWALFFAACGRRSRSAQAGIVSVSVREADDLVRQAQLFLENVLAHVGLPPLGVTSLRMTPVSVG